MDDQTPDLPGLEPVVGEAARGWVRVQLDADGRCGDVVLDPRALDLSTVQLGEAVRDAFRQAQSLLRDRAGQAADGLAGGRLIAVLDESTAVADQRFGEISDVLYGLERRAGRQW